MNAKLAILVPILAIFATAFSVVSCQTNVRTPHRYLIPNGYVGWVRIDFEVKGSPESNLEDEFRVFRIPVHGFLQTSSRLAYGVAADEYYYVDNDLRKLPVTRPGGGGMIWNGFNGSWTDGQNTQIYEYFFVGAEEEFEKFGKPDLLPGRRPEVGDIRNRKITTND